MTANNLLRSRFSEDKSDDEDEYEQEIVSSVSLDHPAF